MSSRDKEKEGVAVMERAAAIYSEIIRSGLSVDEALDILVRKVADKMDKQESSLPLSIRVSNMKFDLLTENSRPREAAMKAAYILAKLQFAEKGKVGG
jgi:antitoxin component of RelBE/YafQ-DinJ toxin-antitoxin module